MGGQKARQTAGGWMGCLFPCSCQPSSWLVQSRPLIHARLEDSGVNDHHLPPHQIRLETLTRPAAFRIHHSRLLLLRSTAMVPSPVHPLVVRNSRKSAMPPSGPCVLDSDNLQGDLACTQDIYGPHLALRMRMGRKTTGISKACGDICIMS